MHYVNIILQIKTHYGYNSFVQSSFQVVSMIKVKRLSKRYTQTLALDNVSFDLKPGVIYGFLGPNGAGKTTAMRIMTGFIRPDSGSVTYDGRDIAENNLTITEKIGYLPENNPLYENMRVDEFLTFVSSVKGGKTDLKVVAVECGLTQVLTKEIGELSKGYKQRVGLAKALIGNPDYLILDEPSTGLDPNQKTEILDLIKKAGKQKTILFSSHVLSEVEAIADELIIINKGEIVAKGSAAEISLKHLKGSMITLEIDTSSTTALPKLKKIKLLDDVKSAGSKNKFYKYEIITRDSNKASVEIFKTAVKEKWLVKELHSETSNLENLFKELTKK